jgi:hypothetical protein
MRHRLVAFALELVRQLGPAALHDPALRQHVDEVGPHVVEQPLVVGDQQHALVGLRMIALMPSPTIRSASMSSPNRSRRAPRSGVEDAHLDHLGALLLAAREADVHRPLEHLHVHPQQPAFSRASLRKSPPDSGSARAPCAAR